jgi:hypothetical protein
MSNTKLALINDSVNKTVDFESVVPHAYAILKYRSIDCCTRFK